MTDIPKPKFKYVARDQYGNTVFIREHPRKELMDYLGVRHASIMYREFPGGDIIAGYVVGRSWFDVYGLEGVRFRRVAGRARS